MSMKIFKPTVLLIGAVLVIGTFIAVAQQSQSQTATDEKRMEDIEKMQKEQVQMFWKVSTSDNPTDIGNRIVAVRRVVRIVDDYNNQQGMFKNKIQMVEIELYSKVLIPVTNESQFAQIGEKILTPHRSADAHSLFILLEKKDFDELEDGEIISYTIGNPNNLVPRKTSVAGEPFNIIGAKFGKLDKKMIDRFPAIEEDAKETIKRQSGTKNLPE